MLNDEWWIDLLFYRDISDKLQGKSNTKKTMSGKQNQSKPKDNRVDIPKDKPRVNKPKLKSRKKGGMGVTLRKRCRKPKKCKRRRGWYNGFQSVLLRITVP